MTTEKAFDLERYKERGNFNYKALERDTSALGVEASVNRPVEKRVWRTVEAFWQGRVVQGRVDKERDVLNYFSESTPTYRKERIAGEKMRDMVINGQEDTVFVWISPPTGAQEYEEGRIRVGVKKVKLGIPLIETYGVPVVGTTAEACFNQFTKLAEFAQTADLTRDSEEMREKVLFFDPKGEDWVSYLKRRISSQIVPEAVWVAIASGAVAKENARAHKLAQAVVESQKSELLKALNEREESLIHIGAGIERELISLGLEIKSGPCGALNLDLVKKLRNPLTTRTVAFLLNEKGKWNYIPGYCRRPPHGCGCHKREVGPCGICKDCEKKYD